jgi:RNA-directed DNA polymerase
MGKLTLAVSHLDNLFHAWRAVRAQVQRSTWPQIAAELAEIDAAPIQTLRAIHRRLRQGEYRFSPKWGYAKRKSGGSRRGITVHGVSDRIVQRSILNVLSTCDPSLRAHLGEIPAIIDTPTSFAGTPGRGVPEAIALSVKAVRNGARACALSDVKDFFPRVPRREVVDLIRANVKDAEFADLFEVALKTEILNRDDILQWLNLFPLSEIGVAQGSLLSVLVGNLSLHRFDVELNKGGFTTVRYLDDFAIFGPSLDAVSAEFHHAQDELAKLGMTCYAPDDGSQKGFKGLTADGFDFLGCRVHPDGVSPSRAAKRRLVSEVALTIRDAKARMRAAAADHFRRRAEPMYTQTLVRIDKKVRGWGDAYRFVTNRVAFSQLDAVLDRMLAEFRRWYSRYYSEADPRTGRRLSGVALLCDTPPKPPGPE